MEQQENELEQARREIDAVDAEMAALFCRRMDAVRRVAAYKQARGLPVLDASREEAVVAKNCARTCWNRRVRAMWLNAPSTP